VVGVAKSILGVLARVPVIGALLALTTAGIDGQTVHNCYGVVGWDDGVAAGVEGAVGETLVLAGSVLLAEVGDAVAEGVI
jgi:hypothetical protein